jgi:AAA domain
MPPAPGRKRGQRKPRTNQQNKENPQALEAAEVDIVIEDLATTREAKKIMLFGPPGVGKTVLAGGAPRATFLSTEKGTVAAKQAGSKAKLMRAPDWEHVLAAKKKADETMGMDDWLIVDSGTKMQVLYLRWILRTIHEENSARDLDIPAIQDHQKWQNGFKRFCDSLMDADYNVIMTASYMIKEDEEGDDIILPAFTGKGYEISTYVSSQFDVIGWYNVHKKASEEAGHTVRRALFQPYPPWLAKDRFNALGMFQDIPDGDYTAMAEFIEMIDDELKKKEK